MRDEILRILEHPNLKVRAASDPCLIASHVLTYLTEWRKWNQKINLTSEQDELRVLRKHIFDSFQYGRAVDPDSGLVDIGSGAGFPGIFLKVIFPGLKLVLVESQRKRANFLKNVVRAMHLDAVQVFESRVEEVAPCGQLDFAVFRGVGSLAECLEMAGPWLKSGGRVVVRKEPDADGPERLSAKYTPHREIPIYGYGGVASKLMIFEKCST